MVLQCSFSGCIMSTRNHMNLMRFLFYLEAVWEVSTLGTSNNNHLITSTVTSTLSFSLVCYRSGNFQEPLEVLKSSEVYQVFRYNELKPPRTAKQLICTADTGSALSGYLDPQRKRLWSERYWYSRHKILQLLVVLRAYHFLSSEWFIKTISLILENLSTILILDPPFLLNTNYSSRNNNRSCTIKKCSPQFEKLE